MTKKRATSDPFAEFEVSRTQPKEPAYLLRLYVTGNTPQSTRAIVNLKALCESRLRGRYELTIVDLYQTPEAARATGRPTFSAISWNSMAMPSEPP